MSFKPRDLLNPSESSCIIRHNENVYRINQCIITFSEKIKPVPTGTLLIYGDLTGLYHRSRRAPDLFNLLMLECSKWIFIKMSKMHKTSDTFNCPCVGTSLGHGDYWRIFYPYTY